MPAMPAAAVALSRRLFGAVDSGLYPHRATIVRQGATGSPAPDATWGGVARVDPLTIASDVPCRLGAPQLPPHETGAAGAPADAAAYVLAFPLADDAAPLDLRRGDVVTVTGDGVNGADAFVHTVYVVGVDVAKPTDVRRRATCSDAPPGQPAGA